MEVNNDYKEDFPDTGNWNWKTVKIKNTGHRLGGYYNNWKINGVVLHDGKFMTSGTIFEADQFDIINENPFNLQGEDMITVSKKRTNKNDRKC